MPPAAPRRSKQTFQRYLLAAPTDNDAGVRRLNFFVISMAAASICSHLVAFPRLPRAV